MNLTVRVKGMEEVQKKLDGNFLVQPEMVHVRDALVTRIGRPRKTKGFQANPLSIQSPGISLSGGSISLAVAGTPLNPPRTKGTAWQKFVAGLVKGAFMRNQLNAAVKKIAARWAS